jgi:UDP-N-acetylmuramate dehydrogenase
MRWRSDVPLSGRTRYRLGGPARLFGVAGSEAELREALGSLGGEPHRLLGWGANLLVADQGVGEAVIVLEGEFDYLRLEADALEAGAAAGLPAFVGEARRAARHGMSFLEAVPGSVGGALRMNAGSAETGIWDRVRWVDAMRPEGETVRLTADDVRPAYRRVDVSTEWVFLGGSFDAPPGDARAIEDEHARRRRSKVETQVYDLPSCGSIWKNPGPPWGSAWELVDRVGMRGATRGGAQITEKHTNFIANLGTADAADVLWLMRETRRRVHEEIGIWLEPEIVLWGFDAAALASVGAAA